MRSHDRKKKRSVRQHLRISRPRRASMVKGTPRHRMPSQSHNLSLPQFSFFQKSRSPPPPPTAVPSVVTTSDMVAFTTSLLSPTANEPEQLVVIQETSGRDGSPRFQIVLSQTGNPTDVTTTGGGANIYVNAPPHSLWDIHTHPIPSIPSPADLETLLKFDSVKSALLISPLQAGDDHIVIALNKAPPQLRRNSKGLDELEKNYRDTIQSVASELKKNPSLRIGELFSGPESMQYVLDLISKRFPDVARDIIALQRLGKQYGFNVQLLRKDEYLFDKNLSRQKKNHQKKRGKNQK